MVLLVILVDIVTINSLNISFLSQYKTKFVYALPPIECWDWRALSYTMKTVGY